MIHSIAQRFFLADIMNPLFFYLRMSDIHEFHITAKIVKDRDFDSLFRLENNSAFSVALQKILSLLHQNNPNSLNNHQRNLFICMQLENAGQAGHILTFFQEWHPEYVPFTTQASSPHYALENLLWPETTSKSTLC